MGRLRKHEAQQTTHVFYGINRESFKVERASLRRDGMLTMWRGDKYLSTPTGRGRRAESECIIVFGLHDLQAFLVGTEDSDYAKRVIDELRQKAEAMKAQAKS